MFTSISAKNDVCISLSRLQGLFMLITGDLSCCISVHSRFLGGLCASSQITVWRLSMKKNSGARLAVRDFTFDGADRLRIFLF